MEDEEGMMMKLVLDNGLSDLGDLGRVGKV